MHCRWTWPLHTCLCWEEIFRQLDKREFTAPQWHRRYLTVSCATARSPLSDAMCCHIDVGKLLPGEVNSHMAESTPPERAQRSSPPQRLTVTCRGSPHRKHCLRHINDPKVVHDVVSPDTYWQQKRVSVAGFANCTYQSTCLERTRWASYP